MAAWGRGYDVTLLWSIESDFRLANCYVNEGISVFFTTFFMGYISTTVPSLVDDMSQFLRFSLYTTFKFLKGLIACTASFKKFNVVHFGLLRFRMTFETGIS